MIALTWLGHASFRFDLPSGVLGSEIGADAPAVAIRPIGDHFTMGPREASVAADLVGAERVVPGHYGTFPLLTGTPETLRGLLPASVERVAPAPGETISL